MRPLTTLLLALPLLTTAQLSDVNDPPLASGFGLKFWDENTGIASGTNGIYRTEDGGNTWTEVIDIEDGNIGRLEVSLDGMHVLCTTSANILLVSHDAGATWAEQEAPVGLGNIGIADADHWFIT